MNAEEFRTMLEKHDWFYSFSDDHRAYKKGLAEEKRIWSLCEAQPELRDIYREYVATHPMD